MNFQNSKSNPIYNTIPDAMSATQFKHKMGGSATTGTDGNLYVWVGGRVNAKNNQAAGTYTGIIQYCCGTAMKSFYIIFLLMLASAVLYCQSNLTVIKLNDISFGTDFGGREKRLDHSDGGAAKFQIQSKNETNAVITIMLPSFFTNADGSEKIPVSFNERSAAWSTIDNVSSRTTFDPRQPLSLSLKQNQIVYVWIGGALHPSGSQRA